MKYSFFIARECIETGAQDLDLSEQIEVFLVDDWEAAKQLLTSRETTTSSPAISAVGFGDKYLL
jgi:deoxyribose-phosphate aldolase